MPRPPRSCAYVKKLKAIHISIPHRWRFIPNLNIKRDSCGCAWLLDDSLLAIGGFGGHGGIGSVEMIKWPYRANPAAEEGRAWRPLAGMHYERNNPGVTVFKGRVFAAGGASADKLSYSTVEVFTMPENDEDPGQWTLLANRMNSDFFVCYLTAHCDKLVALSTFTLKKNRLS